MKVFGLTGGIGMGKTAAGMILRDRGVAVVDTDVLAREIVEPGQPALEEIRREFGFDMIGANGALRRDELARRVFSDETARKQLEAILHPRIRNLWHARVTAWREEGRTVAVVVIPLLFETGAEKELEATICVACSARSQRDRLLARGWSEKEIDQRNAAQWPAQKKMAAADCVVWTEAGLDVHAAQIERIIPLR